MLSVRASMKSTLARALGLLAMLGVFFLWWKLSGDPGKVVERQIVQGVVEEVRERAYLVRLNDGTSVLVARTRPAEAGTPVQLKVDVHASGERVHWLPDATDQ